MKQESVAVRLSKAGVAATVCLWIVAAGTGLLTGCSSESADEGATFRQIQQNTPDSRDGRQQAGDGTGVDASGNLADGGPAAVPDSDANPSVQKGSGDNGNADAGAQTVADAATGTDLRKAGHFRMPAVAEKPLAEVREIKLLVPEKEFRVVGPEDALRVGYDDIDLLKVLNMEPVPFDCVQHFPEWLNDLDGKRIRIRGFMYPPFQETDIPAFVLARDNDICCMGRDPKRYDVIDVTMREGVTTHYIANRPFDVVGVFRIRPEGARGQLYQLYVIEDAVVIEL